MESSADSSTPSEGPFCLPAHIVRKFAARSQLDFEIGFFSGVLERNPRFVEALKVMSKNLAAKGDYSRGVEVDRRIAQLCPRDSVAHYNLACTLSQLGLVDGALDSLRAALELGYDELEYMRQDRDLEAVRKDPRFQELLDFRSVD